MIDKFNEKYLDNLTIKLTYVDIFQKTLEPRDELVFVGDHEDEIKRLDEVIDLIQNDLISEIDILLEMGATNDFIVDS